MLLQPFLTKEVLLFTLIYYLHRRISTPTRSTPIARKLKCKFSPVANIQYTDTTAQHGTVTQKLTRSENKWYPRRNRQQSTSVSVFNSGNKDGSVLIGVARTKRSSAVMKTDANLLFVSLFFFWFTEKGGCGFFLRAFRPTVWLISDICFPVGDRVRGGCERPLAQVYWGALSSHRGRADTYWLVNSHLPQLPNFRSREHQS